MHSMLFTSDDLAGASRAPNATATYTQSGGNENLDGASNVFLGLCGLVPSHLPDSVIAVLIQTFAVLASACSVYRSSPS